MWWPHKDAYWPLETKLAADVQSFQDAFGTLRYRPCANGGLEAGLEKIAIYVKNDEVTHMARQVPSGWWTSKLGKDMDIEHQSPHELEGKVYGTIACYMSRDR